MDMYGNLFADLDNNTIRDGSELLDVANQLSLLTMMAYSCQEDENLDDWIEEYASKNNMYLSDQKKNFLHMKQDFDDFINREQRKTA